MSQTDRVVAVVVGRGYEELEFWYPVLRYREAGASVTVLGIDGSEVCTGRCGYPVVPDAALVDFAVTPAVVVAPGLVDYPAQELVDKTAAPLRRWVEHGAAVVALSTGVLAVTATGLLEGAAVSCPSSTEAAVVEAGGKVAEDPVSISGRLATARSVDNVAELFGRILLDPAFTPLG